MVLFSPESLQAYDPALGGYIIQIKIISSMQVPCHCKHAPWHLGANARLFLTCLIEDPTHHIVISRPLGVLIAPVKGNPKLGAYIRGYYFQ